jgi:hypothetical protein
MLTFGDNLGAKKGEKGPVYFYCNLCDYKCSKKYSWDRHILTAKHIDAAKCDISAAKCDTFGAKKGENEQHHLTCEFCNKTYLHRQSLWRHYKTCKDTTKVTNESNLQHNNEPTDKQLMMMLIKETSGFKDLILEIVKNGINNTNTNTNTTHTNSHNKAFNLQFFLNETCKNAMNINDFVDSIKLQLSDFMDVGEKGFVEGISNIIIKNLNALDEMLDLFIVLIRREKPFM